MTFLTILGQSREARACPGHRGNGSAANQENLTPTSDRRVDARGPADVRTTFAWHVACVGNSSPI